MNKLVTREIKADEKHQFLRFQAGVWEQRSQWVATYTGKQDGGKYLGLQEGGPKAVVFKLLGWGETEELALIRAERNLCTSAPCVA